MPQHFRELQVIVKSWKNGIVVAQQKCLTLWGARRVCDRHYRLHDGHVYCAVYVNDGIHTIEVYRSTGFVRR